MPAPRPQRKSEQIFLDVLDHIEREMPYDELFRARMLRGIAEIERADLQEAAEARAMLAAWEWDADGVRRHYDKAIEAQDDPDLRARYMKFLWRLNQSARVQADSAIARWPGNPKILETAARSYSFLGDFRRSLEIYRLYNGLKQGSEHRHTESLTEIVSVIGSSEASWSIVTACHEATFNLLHEARVPSTSQRVEIERDVEGVSVCVYISVPRSLERVAELDDELAVRLFDAAPGLNFNEFWIGLEVDSDYVPQ